MKNDEDEDERRRESSGDGDPSTESQNGEDEDVVTVKRERKEDFLCGQEEDNDGVQGWKTWSRDMKPIAEAILYMVESKFDKEFGGCKNGIMKS
ncbi:unnamed protein product [Vicia faba]|uniref:Uncharacterized protein n=1 Tax=Vicia faba TaxID=3906 RepID=A0AAV0ZVV5_VICFA|nr:unnamed protein product [Vicia faba]